VGDVGRCFVGVLRSDSLHLSPLYQTLQLRPTLSYLDRLSFLEKQARRKQRMATMEEDSEDDDMMDEDEEVKKKKPPPKAVQVSVKSTSGDSSSNRGPSLFDPLRKFEDEDWQEMEHFHSETQEANEAFESLICENPQDNLICKTEIHELLQ